MNREVASATISKQAEAYLSTPTGKALQTALCGCCGTIGAILLHREQTGAAHTFFFVAYIAGMLTPLREIAAAFSRREIDVNLLMVLAALGAAFTGHFGEGVGLLFLFSLSGTLESYTLERTARSIQALVELRPDTVIAIRDGQEQKVPLAELQLGETIRVRPAERLAVDGVILDGISAIDESTLTGESIPLEKTPGDRVFAGTLNHRGTLLVRAECKEGETLLARIVRQVKDAQDEKTRLQQKIERYQQPYVIAVLLLTAATISVHLLLRGEALAEAFYKGMLLLVAASPCAIVISTPAATLAGLIRAARNGVLFKSGQALERLARIKALTFDKTGTLTKGRPQLVEIWTQTQDEASQIELLRLAAAAEKYSEHGLGQAVFEAALARKIEIPEPYEFASYLAAGVTAVVLDRQVAVGSERLYRQLGIELPADLTTQLQRMRSSGQTPLIATISGSMSETAQGKSNQARTFGLLGVADTVRATSAQAVGKLRTMGFELTMLTGDHEAVARKIQQEVGLNEVRFGLLPEEKVAEVRRKRERFGAIAHVGDGVNDAPALAAADVGIAMGGVGTDAALDTADVVLMKDNLNALPFALNLSYRVRAAVRRGLALAALSIVVNVICVLFGWIPLWLAVLIHEGSTILAILSGLYVLVEQE